MVARLSSIPCSYLFLAVLLPCFFSLPVTVAWGHRITVFAYPSDREIVVEGHSGSHRPVIHGKVTVTDPNTGKPLVSGRTDNQGIFRFTGPVPIPSRGLQITLEADAGHRAVWNMLPADLSETGQGEQTPRQPASTPVSSRTELSPQQQDDHLTRMIQQAVAREIEPLKHMLANHVNHGPTLQEIIGGLGWLVGIGGLLLALREGRKK